MDSERMEELRRFWNRESEDPETLEWRDELTPEELDVVSGWDTNYDNGVLAISSAILVRELICRSFSPQEIQEIETVHDHCRLRLRDGRLFLARLGADNSLRLDEIDGVC